MDSEFQPNTGFGYPTPKIRPEPDSDFYNNCNNV